MFTQYHFFFKRRVKMKLLSESPHRKLPLKFDDTNCSYFYNFIGLQNAKNKREISIVLCFYIMVFRTWDWVFEYIPGLWNEDFSPSGHIQSPCCWLNPPLHPWHLSIRSLAVGFALRVNKGGNLINMKANLARDSFCSLQLFISSRKENNWNFCFQITDLSVRLKQVDFVLIKWFVFQYLIYDILLLRSVWFLKILASVFVVT